MSLPCNCCEQPPCGVPVLEFRSVTIIGTLDECGYGYAGDDPDFIGKTFRVVTKTQTITSSYQQYAYEADEEGEGGSWVLCASGTYTGTATTTDTASPTEGGGCCYRTSSIGSASGTDTYHTGGCLPSPVAGSPESGSVSYSASGEESSDSCDPEGDSSEGSSTTTFSFVYSDGEGGTETISGSDTADWADYFVGEPDTWDGATGTSSETNDNDDPESGDHSTTTTTVTHTYSDLIEMIFPEFPAYPAWEGESEDELLTGQGYEESSFNSTSSRTKIQWRLRHPPSGTCYLKAWVRKTFTPAPTDPPTDPPPEPTVTVETYEWNGTGNPCLTDPMKAGDHDDNRITGDENEVLPPEELGETLVELIKFSCVDGYDPDITDPDNPQPNGYPNPEWEAAPP
jgi:hypothetical protein